MTTCCAALTGRRTDALPTVALLLVWPAACFCIPSTGPTPLAAGARGLAAADSQPTEAASEVRIRACATLPLLLLQLLLSD